MTATVVKFKPSAGHLECSECGASARASCNCGAPYVPAGTRATEAVAANPKKSDRAIAKEIGVSQPTVSRARQKSGDTNVSPVARIGRDGKKYPATQKPKPKKPKKASDQVNAMQRSVANFAHDYMEELNKWLESKPQLTTTMISTLANTLHLCSEEFERMARHVEKLGRRQ
jgi:hypothetical protein